MLLVFVGIALISAAIAYFVVSDLGEMIAFFLTISVGLMLSYFLDFVFFQLMASAMSGFAFGGIFRVIKWKTASAP